MHHLGFEGEDLVGQLLLLFFQQLVDLVGFNSFAHQFEVGVVLLSQLLQQAAVLFLHVLKGLAGHVHLAQKSLLLLSQIRNSDSVSGRIDEDPVIAADKRPHPFRPLSYNP